VSFAGRLGSLTFTDAAEFEKAARVYTGSVGVRDRFRMGDEILMNVDGTTVRGQVWALAPEQGAYWVAGENGRAYHVGPKMSVGGRTVRRVELDGGPSWR
jgi:hypothetical protein